MNLAEQNSHIEQTFTLFASPDGVVEVRSLKIGKYKQTASGYYEADASGAFVDGIRDIAKMKPAGIYATVNVVGNDLLARAANRVQFPADTTTADVDVTRRRWIPVDMDAFRPSGISATDDEHDDALTRITACRDWLKKTYSTNTVLADSGNGGHCLVPCDLPNDPASAAASLSLVAGVLAGLAKQFNDDVVHVDTSVGNAARILKVYGTLVAKGDNLPLRPHRYARLLDVPSSLPPVSVETLQSIAALATPAQTAPRPASKASTGYTGKSLDPFDVPAFLAKHGIAVHHEEEGAGGWHQWALEACPFNPDHTNPDSMVSQQAGTGKVSFHCRHNSCKGNKWQQFRAHFEPEYKPFDPNRPNPHSSTAHKSGKETQGETGEAGEEGTDGDGTEERADKALPYIETALGLLWLRPTRDGVVKTPLTNFTARIVSDIVEDDGAETSLRYHIQARRNGKQACFIIPHDAFNSFGWVSEHLGIGAACYPGPLNKEHAQFAIRQISEAQGSTREITYTHTGWRELAPGQWAYLHAGGVIGAAVPDGVNVRLSDIGKHYVLPTPAEPDALRAAIVATLHLTTLGPDAVMLPLLAAIFRAALSTSDFSLSLSGPSGAFKSELAALAQRHYGADMDANHLPGSWSSTENALEELAFRIKDALLVVDDFAPTGSQHDIARLHAKADRVLRAQGNGSGRQRMRRDGTLYAARPPRGLILSTGEDIPQGKSLRARQFILEVGPNDINAQKLTLCQKDAAAGLYAQCMTGFLAWYSPRYERAKETYAADIERLRAQAQANVGRDAHRRTPEIVADLCLGLSYFFQFAQASGVLTQEEVTAWYARGSAALLDAAAAQALHQQSSDPALRFLDLVRSALSSGTAHVANMDGQNPDAPQAWGWRQALVGTGQFEALRWQPQGERIGWTDGTNLYLEKDAAFKAIRKQGGESDGIALTPTALYKRLDEGHHLASTEKHSTRGTLHVRRKAEGKTQNVLHLLAEAVLRTKSDISDISDIEAEEV